MSYPVKVMLHNKQLNSMQPRNYFATSLLTNFMGKLNQSKIITQPHYKSHLDDWKSFNKDFHKFYAIMNKLSKDKE